MPCRPKAVASVPVTDRAASPRRLSCNPSLPELRRRRLLICAAPRVKAGVKWVVFVVGFGNSGFGCAEPWLALSVSGGALSEPGWV
jgi:hypothetical protein